MQLAVPIIQLSFDLKHCMANKAEKAMSVYVAAQPFPYGSYKITRALELFMEKSLFMRDFQFDGYPHVWANPGLTTVQQNQLAENGWHVLQYAMQYGRSSILPAESPRGPALFDLIGIASIIQSVSTDYSMMKRWIDQQVYIACTNEEKRKSLMDRYMHEIGYIIETKYHWAQQRGHLWPQQERLQLNYGQDAICLVHPTMSGVYEIWFDLKDLGFVVRCPKHLREPLKNNFGPFVTQYLGDF